MKFLFVTVSNTSATSKKFNVDDKVIGLAGTVWSSGTVTKSTKLSVTVAFDIGLTKTFDANSKNVCLAPKMPKHFCKTFKPSEVSKALKHFGKTTRKHALRKNK